MTEEQIITAIMEVVNYYEQHRSELKSWWEIAALRSAGINLSKEKWEISAWDFDALQEGGAATDYAGSVLGLLLLGKDHAAYEDEKKIVDGLLALQEEDGSFGKGINNTVWGIIALKCAAGDSFTPEMQRRAIDFLMTQQKEDGGFAYRGNTGDSETTAVVLHALAFFKEVDEIDETIKKALSFLKKQLLDTGGFASSGQEDANTVAMVISGLIAAGGDPLGPGWSRTTPLVNHSSETDNTRYTLLDILLQYQLGDGSFSYLPGDDSTDNLATAQALMALGALTAEETVFSRVAKSSPVPATAGEILSDEIPADEDDEATEDDAANDEDNEETDLEPENGLDDENDAAEGRDEEDEEDEQITDPDDDIQETVTVFVRVEGREKVLYHRNIRLKKDEATVLQALNATGLSYEMCNDGLYVSEIAGDKENPDTGAVWRYRVGTNEPDIPAADVPVQARDVILWWYATDSESLQQQE